MADGELIHAKADPMPVWDRDANPCPPLSEDEYRRLRASLENNGFVAGWPIVRSAGPACEGELIDGFHRTTLCEELGIEPVVALVVCETETEFRILQIMANVSRRQLNTAQKSSLGMELLGLYTERARERMLAGKKVQSNPTQPVGEGQPEQTEKGEAIRQAAEAVGISHETLRQRKVIQDAGRSDILDRIDGGNLSVKAGYNAVISERDEAVKNQQIAERELDEHFNMDTTQAADAAHNRLCDSVIRLATELDLMIRKNCLIEGDIIDYKNRPHTFKGTAERVGSFLSAISQWEKK